MASAPAPRPPRASVSSHSHTHTQTLTYTRAHTKGRSHIRARPRGGGGAGGEDAQRPFRAPALAAAGGASPHFERGFSLRRGRQNGGGGASLRPSGRTWRPSASGQVPRAGEASRARPGTPTFHGLGLKKKTPKKKKRQATPTPPWQREGGGGRSGFCPSSLFTRRNFRPDVFSQSRNASRGQSDRKRRPLPAPSQRRLRPPEQSLMRRRGALRAG
ncbi:hypothetical protein ACRRTK_008270 [Alexandromys fortis]